MSLARTSRAASARSPRSRLLAWGILLGVGWRDATASTALRRSRAIRAQRPADFPPSLVDLAQLHHRRFGDGVADHFVALSGEFVHIDPPGVKRSRALGDDAGLE